MAGAEELAEAGGVVGCTFYVVRGLWFGAEVEEVEEVGVDDGDGAVALLEFREEAGGFEVCECGRAGKDSQRGRLRRRRVFELTGRVVDDLRCAQGDDSLEEVGAKELLATLPSRISCEQAV